MGATFCTRCGANLLKEHKFCPNCGQPASAASTIQHVDYVDLGDYGAQPIAQPVYEQFQQAPTSPVPVYFPDRKNPGVAAVLSFFWAGLGQIYNGQLAKGIGFMVLYGFSVLLIFVLIGLLLAPIVWLIGMWDAYHTAQQYNERQLQNERLYYDSLRR